MAWNIAQVLYRPQ
uniref:Uncharacterized protein n=1 Tax=Arundo donax TaxID=35708 RepID=A0A0A9HKZ0_ARUDO